MQFIIDNFIKIAVALIAVLAGVGITIKLSRRTDKSKTTTTQTGNIVQGDQAGRDINK